MKMENHHFLIGDTSNGYVSIVMFVFRVVIYISDIYEYDVYISTISNMWIFPRNTATPKWMVKIMENPTNKWMIWGVLPLFLETPRYDVTIEKQKQPNES